jgi:hypothetical protein
MTEMYVVANPWDVVLGHSDWLEIDTHRFDPSKRFAVGSLKMPSKPPIG